MFPFDKHLVSVVISWCKWSNQTFALFAGLNSERLPTPYLLSGAGGGGGGGGTFYLV